MNNLYNGFERSKQVKTWHNVDRNLFEQEILSSHQPAIIKGLVKDWPTVNNPSHELKEHLVSLSLEKSIQCFSAKSDTHGFFTFNSDVKSFNFEKHNTTISKLLERILCEAPKKAPNYHYAGAINIPDHLPGFLPSHPLPILDNSVEKLVSIWIGNRSRIPAHWDFPHNLACVTHGKRRFILFPTEQMENLYIGPIDVTIAGQPSSLVDFHNVDVERFPRFDHAVKHAQIAELNPGDAIYIPSLWLHHVESLDTLGVLVNFWWRNDSKQRFTPLLTLMHGLLSVRELPHAERQAWKFLFDHYLFNQEEQHLDHIPASSLSVLGDLTPEQELNLRRFLAHRLLGESSIK